MPRFKANLIARYTFPLGDWNGFSQAAVVYQDSSVPLLFPSFYQTGNNGTQHLGEMPPYTLVNLSAGAEINGTQVSVLVNNTFNVLGEIGRFSACTQGHHWCRCCVRRTQCQGSCSRDLLSAPVPLPSP